MAGDWKPFSLIARQGFLDLISCSAQSYTPAFSPPLSTLHKHHRASSKASQLLYILGEIFQPSVTDGHPPSPQTSQSIFQNCPFHLSINLSPVSEDNCWITRAKWPHRRNLNGLCIKIHQISLTREHHRDYNNMNYQHSWETHSEILQYRKCCHIHIPQ